MIHSFPVLLKKLQFHSNRFDDVANQSKINLLLLLGSIPLKKTRHLIPYSETLLFLCSHPADEHMQRIVEKELFRLTTFLSKKENRNQTLFLNSGLPYAPTLTTFSHDLTQWLSGNSQVLLEEGKTKAASYTLNDVLGFTLPAVERDQVQIGYSDAELLKALALSEKQKISFLIREFGKLNHVPYIKDFLYDKLNLHVRIHPVNKRFSKAYNRLALQALFFHTDLLKKFDHRSLFAKPVPAPVHVSEKELQTLVSVIKTSLTLMARETDPVTYMDERSLRWYPLDRGISIALYGMVPSRQLPFESYVGYTLFKNGFPAAYGGGWVFGKRALFGINIFESFRGGESGFMMCQLLRLYMQVFQIDYFEVEPYQYGKDNPEGIESGAFWFYYRYGFRPVDTKIAQLAAKEKQKIDTKPAYRSSKKTLERFLDSNICLKLGTKTPLYPSFFTHQITRMIARDYKGDRVQAVEDSLQILDEQAKNKLVRTPTNRYAWEEMALLAKSLKITKREQLECLIQMIPAKTVSLYEYQNLLLQFLAAVGFKP